MANRKKTMARRTPARPTRPHLSIPADIGRVRYAASTDEEFMAVKAAFAIFARAYKIGDRGRDLEILVGWNISNPRRLEVMPRGTRATISGVWSREDSVALPLVQVRRECVEVLLYGPNPVMTSRVYYSNDTTLTGGPSLTTSARDICLADLVLLNSGPDTAVLKVGELRYALGLGKKD